MRMNRQTITWLGALWALGCTAPPASHDAGVATDAAWPFVLPVGFPPPPQPADNLATPSKAELGRHLFYDARLSINGTTSCATCHRQASAFTDGRPHSVGATGESTARGAMALQNLAYASSLTWANPLQQTLEEQLLIPLFGTHPVEMGMAGRENDLLTTLREDPTYRTLFSAAFPDDADPFTIQRVAQGIAVFERTLISGNSPWDRFNSGDDPTVVSSEVRRGATLFFGERLECYHCHGGFLFTDHGGAQGTESGQPFHNNGLYNLDGAGAYPEGNQGVYSITGRAVDMGKFKAPTLRNITLTAPYMHDGTLPTLDAVLDHYAAGGNTVPSQPDGGVGRDNPLKSSLLLGFVLTPQERQDLLAFLGALTDEGFMTDPRFADPWRDAGTP